MLFPDRLEIMNPGKLPVGLTIEDLYSAHKSIPANPLIADAFYLNGTIEKAGTGTGDIVAYCTKMGLKKPTFKQGSGFDVILYRKTYEDQPTDRLTNPPT
jgi:predicted HTH transcriptional regulator